MIRKLLLIACFGVTFPALADWDDGVAAFQKKNFDAAAKSFEQLIEEKPDAWQGHYMLGRSLIPLRRAEEALHHLRQAHDLNPNEHSVKLELGRAYALVRRYIECAQILGTVDLNRLPERQRETSARIRGQCRNKSGDTRGAYEDFRWAAKLDPRDVRTNYLAGVLALKEGDHETARQYLEEAKRIDHDDIDLKIKVREALSRVLKAISRAKRLNSL